MKNIVIILFLIFSNFLVLGQKVNNYKYIVVSEKFNFLNENNQYQTSSLTKFLLEKNGFTVVLDSEQYAKELINNPCKGLKVGVVDKSSMFKTKLVIEFKDCYNKLIYTSGEGESRQKDYKRSFQEAIRNAHKTISNLKYEPVKDQFKIEQNISVIDKPAVNKKLETINSNEKVLEIVRKTRNKTEIKNTTTEVKTLYAQPNNNGFQLINLKPAVVFILLKTNVDEVFIIKDKNGVLYKKDFFWIAEFYKDGKMLVEKYEIKF